MAVKVAVAVKEKAHRRYAPAARAAPNGSTLLLIYNTCVYDRMFLGTGILVELIILLDQIYMY